MLLSVDNNQLTELPPEIGNLNYLGALLLYNNQLTELPPEISNLNNLGLLWLEGNQLTELPPEIEELAQATRPLLEYYGYFEDKPKE